MHSNRSHRASSSYRSKLFLDPSEKAEMEKFAKVEYDHEIDVLRHTEGVTEADVEHFQKSAIIKKSVEEVQRRAMEQKVVRSSPQRYKTVKSKVAQCLKVQSKVTKKKTALKNKETMN
jgi:hypothetical protein